VRKSVSIVVRHRCAQAIAIHRQARLLRDVGERSVPVVPIEGGGVGTAAGKAGQARAVDEEEVQLAVAVIVQKGAAGAQGLRQKEAARSDRWYAGSGPPPPL